MESKGWWGVQGDDIVAAIGVPDLKRNFAFPDMSVQLERQHDKPLKHLGLSRTLGRMEGTRNDKRRAQWSFPTKMLPVKQELCDSGRGKQGGIISRDSECRKQTFAFLNILLNLFIYSPSFCQ